MSTTNFAPRSAECMAPDNRYAYLQRFTYTRGSTKIKVAPNSSSNQDFCLDLGVVRRQDGTNLHLYECVDVPQQQFWITDDDHIALEGESSGSLGRSIALTVVNRRQPVHRHQGRQRVYPERALQ